MASTTVYSRPSKPPVPAASGDRRGAPRLAKELGRIEPKKLGIGLVAGCCLALLTYLSFARLFAIYSPVFESTSSLVMKNVPTVPVAETNKQKQEPLPQKTGAGDEEEKDRTDPEADPTIPNLPEQEAAVTTTTKPAATTKAGDGAKITCDENGVDEGFPYARPPVCELAGDIRISPKDKTMFFVNPSGAGPFDANGEKKIRPFARKDDFLLPGVVEVTIKSVAGSTPQLLPECTRRHDVPAVVFSVAGYTDNFFHDNTDVLIPLFLTASHLKGEVQLLVTNFKPWWVRKFTPLLRAISNYEPINFDEEQGVHCFRAAHLGLYRDRDLIIKPHATRNPRNLTMVDYNRFLRRALRLPRDAPAALGDLLPTSATAKPRMLVIERKGTRKLLNLREVVAACEGLGFHVTVAEASSDVGAFAKLVNSVDVLLAVHGAGLTNQIFLPTGAVLVQIVPWGKMDWMATNFYGQPAKDMGLRYVEYYVSEEETTLKDKYPRDHYVFKDPMAIHAQGWPAIADIIMKQDVSVNMTRFKPFLLKALDELQQ